MKTNLFLASSLFFAAALASCTNDVENVASQGDFSVEASMGVQSRTSLAGNGTTVVWSEGDQIYLFGGSSNSTMTLVSGAGQTTATFQGGVNGFPSQLTHALYPVPTLADGEFTYDFPSEIAYSENSNAPMIGDLTEGGQVGFDYLSPLIRIPLSGLNPTMENTLTLQMQGITGKATVNMESRTLEFSNEGKGNVVTVTIPEGLASCNIDIPVPAGIYNGYTVKLNGEIIRSSNEVKNLSVDNTLVIGESVAAQTEYIAFSTEILQSEGSELEIGDYAILGSDGVGYIYDFQESDSQLPERVTIWDGTVANDDESARLVVSFNEQGLPVSILHKDFTIVLGNHIGNKFDAFVTTSAGESAIWEDLELQDDMTWDSYLEELAQNPEGRALRMPSIGTVNAIVGVVGCGVSVAATIVSAPTGIGAVVGWGLTSISCGSAILTLTDNAGWINAPDELSGVTTALSGIAAIVSCINPQNPVGVASCIAGGLGTVIGIVDILISDREDEVDLGNGALVSGNGDIKFTLTWDKPSDIDLHCEDAERYHIYYGNKQPAGSKGFLDFDNIPGFPDCTDPENIYFEAPAPSGQYRVYLHYFSDHNNQGPVNYTVLVMIDGEGQTYRGTINRAGDYVEIITFNYGDADSRALPEFRPIPWDWNNLPSKF